jgi:TolB-like protein
MLAVLGLTIGRGQTLAAQPANRRLAVLEFQGKKIEEDVLRTFGDGVRGGAVEGLAACRVQVMTRENMMVLLREMGKSDCSEGDCEVETARNIGADFVVSGFVVHMEDTYVVTLKLHETKDGSLLASDSVQAHSQIDMLNQLRGHGRDLVAKNIRPLPIKTSEIRLQVETTGGSAGNRPLRPSVVGDNPRTPSEKGASSVPSYRSGGLFLPSIGVHFPNGDRTYSAGVRVGALFGGHVTDNFSLAAELGAAIFGSKTDFDSNTNYALELALSPLCQFSLGRLEMLLGPKIGPFFGYAGADSAKGIVAGATVGALFPGDGLAMGILVAATRTLSVSTYDDWAKSSLSLSVAALF